MPSYLTGTVGFKKNGASEGKGATVRQKIRLWHGNSAYGAGEGVYNEKRASLALRTPLRHSREPQTHKIVPLT